MAGMEFNTSFQFQRRDGDSVGSRKPGGKEKKATREAERCAARQRVKLLLCSTPEPFSERGEERLQPL